MNFSGKIRKITIQTPPTVKDAGGELTGSWTTFLKTYAKLVDVSSNESKAEGTEVMTVIRMFIIRYKNTITSNMRILFDNKYWEITGIRQIGTNEFTEISTVLKSNE
jgi:SPP1 family predicted phage head-tail adaptor